jgi:hypothetical protein
MIQSDERDLPAITLKHFQKISMSIIEQDFFKII